MTSRPSQYLVAGKKVLDKFMGTAPSPVRIAVRDLLNDLQKDPYPREGRHNVAAVRGVGVNHLYVAWCNEAQISYKVAQDQPVILLVGIRWTRPPSGPGEGEDGDAPEIFLAA